jgi:hypothetical protein
MELIGGFALLGGLVGACVGYFLSIYVVIALTAVVAWLLYSETKPVPWRRGSGHIGVVLFGGAFLVSFLLSMWITWFFTSTTSIGFDMQPVLDFLRHYILK